MVAGLVAVQQLSVHACKLFLRGEISSAYHYVLQSLCADHSAALA